jgi:hypothetical protein
MAGIISYGGYIPLWRLPRDAIAEAWGSGSIRGERSVANNDEDTLTWGILQTFGGGFPSGSCSSTPGQRVRLSLTQFLNGGKIYG